MRASTSPHCVNRWPIRRSARPIVAKVGQAEAARMSSLSDDDLKDELINMSTQTVEETMFVPKLESSNYAHPQHIVNTAGQSRGEWRPLSNSCAVVSIDGASPAQFPKLLKVVPSSALHLAGSGPAARRSNRRSQHGPVLLSHRLYHRPRLRMAMGRVDLHQLVRRRLYVDLRHPAARRLQLRIRPALSHPDNSQVSNRRSPQQFSRGKVDAAIRAHRGRHQRFPLSRT